MKLSSEQKKAVRNGEPVRAQEPGVGECVVLRADVYDRLRRLIYEDSPLSEDEKLFAIQEAGRRAGWDDPELDVYEEYRRKP